MQTRDLLVQNLGQNVHAHVQLAGLAELDVLLAECLVLGLVQQDLREDLVGEGAAHDERAVARRTAEVDEAALGEEDDVAAGRHLEAVDLGLDVLDGLGSLLDPRDVDLNVEVADVADDGVVGHGLEVFADDDVAAAGGGDEDLADGSGLVHRDDLEATHCGLEGVDGVDLGDEHAGAHPVERLRATLADVAEARHDGDLACDHDVGCPLDAVDEGLAAAVEVVEFGFGDGVVDVDGGGKQTVLLTLVLQHAVQVVDTGGGFLGDAVAALEEVGVLGVDERSEVTAIVEYEVEGLAGGEGG